MFRPGLVSITFRQLSPKQLCRLAADAQLQGIEWGGDVHAPVGDLDAARQVAGLTAEHGLSVAAYGSYYRMGVTEPEQWGATIDTARALGADKVRVWAGQTASAETDPQARQRIVDDARRCCDLADAQGLQVVCEWHGGTLTDEASSAAAFFDAVDHPAMKTYWQPHQRMGFADCMSDMDAAMPRLAGVHVFHWAGGFMDRLALAEGQDVWPAYLQKAAKSPVLPGRGDEPSYALLEFVRGDDPEQLEADAATLRRWLGELSQ